MTTNSRRPGWTTVRLGSVVNEISTRIDNPSEAEVNRFVGLEHFDSGELKIRRWGTTGDLISAMKLFRAGDTLFARRNAYLRRASMADSDGVCSGDAIVLRPKESAIVQGLLPAVLNTDAFWEYALSHAAGSMSKRVNIGSLLNYEFALPPIEEQKRIAELLWAADDAVDQFRHTDHACQGLLLSLSSHFFPCASGTGASDYKQLGEVCALQAGYPFGSHEYMKTGDRLLRGSNVGVNATVWTDENTCFWPLVRRHEVSEYVLHEGDIVVAMDRPFIGEGFKIARISSHDLPCLLLQRVGRFIPTHELDNDYLWAYLRSRSFRQHLLSAQHGTELPHISTSDIESAILPVPSLREQHRIAGFFQVVERSRAALATHSSSVSRLLKNLEEGMMASEEDTRV